MTSTSDQEETIEKGYTIELLTATQSLGMLFKRFSSDVEEVLAFFKKELLERREVGFRLCSYTTLGYRFHGYQLDDAFSIRKQMIGHVTISWKNFVRDPIKVVFSHDCRTEVPLIARLMKEFGVDVRNQAKASNIAQKDFLRYLERDPLPPLGASTKSAAKIDTSWDLDEDSDEEEVNHIGVALRSVKKI